MVTSLNELNILERESKTQYKINQSLKDRRKYKNI